MSTAVKQIPSVRLRVALHATAPLRRLALRKILADAGYVVVEAQDAADAVG